MSKTPEQDAHERSQVLARVLGTDLKADLDTDLQEIFSDIDDRRTAFYTKHKHDDMIALALVVRQMVIAQALLMQLEQSVAAGTVDDEVVQIAHHLAEITVERIDFYRAEATKGLPS